MERFTLISNIIDVLRMQKFNLEIFTSCENFLQFIGVDIIGILSAIIKRIFKLIVLNTSQQRPYFFFILLNISDCQNEITGLEV